MGSFGRKFAKQIVESLPPALREQAKGVQRRREQDHGVRAAAWIARQHKGLIHSAGGMRFIIPPGENRPLWFRLAMEVFRRRSKSWEVDEHTRDDGGRAITVSWLRRRKKR